MSIEVSKEPSVNRQEPVFSRQEYIDNVLAVAITYQGDDSPGIPCRNCGEEEPNWDLPIGYMQPPHMSSGPLCVAC